MFRHSPGSRAGPARARCRAQSSSASAVRARIAIGLTTGPRATSARPRRSVAASAAMPRWRAPTRHRSARSDGPASPRAAALSRKARTHVASALLVARKQHAQLGASLPAAHASASRMAAIAPLVSAAPSPCSLPSRSTSV